MTAPPPITGDSGIRRNMSAEDLGPDLSQGTGLSNEEGRPVHQAASASSVILETTVRRGTDSQPTPRPVVPFVARGVQQDSDARLAGELAAARVALLEPMTNSEKCWECAALGIRELQLLGWDRRTGWRTATCPHVLLEAS